MRGRIRDALLNSVMIISLLLTLVLSSYSETINYFYDELNRLKRVEYGDGTVIEYVYDKTGNRTYICVGEFPLTVNVVGNGTVTKNPDQPLYSSGTNVTLTAVNGSQTFSEWSGDLSGSTNPAVIVMDGQKWVTATFITPEGWLQGWTYRKPVTLSRASGAVTNYQMRLLVGETSGASGENVDCNGHVKSDFSDLRFTKADGLTNLDYWIESVTGTTPNQLATVWIEFDSIGVGATAFYMYYGNAGASSASNGVNTFLFFDDFNRADSSTVGNGWVQSGSPSCYSIESNKLKIVQGNSETCTRAFTFSSQMMLECKMRVNSQLTNQPYIALLSYGTVINKYAAWNMHSGYRYRLGAPGWYYVGTYTKDTDYIIGIRTDSLANGTYGPNVDYYWNRVEEVPGIWSLYNTTTTNTIGWWKANYPGNGYVDWVLVRKDLDTKPAWGTWGAEEAN